MPQHMRMHMGWHADFTGMGGKTPLDRSARQPAALAIDEERIGLCAIRMGLPTRSPSRQRCKRGSPNRYTPGLIALTDDKDFLGLGIDPAEVLRRRCSRGALIERDQFRKPQAAGIHQLQHGRITGL